MVTGRKEDNSFSYWWSILNYRNDGLNDQVEYQLELLIRNAYL